MLQSPIDFMIVKLAKAFEDEMVFESGVKLYKETSLNPEWNTTVTGTVVSVPKRLSKRLELKGLSIEPKPGDEIMFSYMVVFDMDLRDRDSPVHHNLFYHEGEYYWKVDYFHYLGRIIDGKILPAQGYVFCEPAKPAAAERIGNIWMPETVQKQAPKGKATVAGIGKPKEGEPALSIQEGDTVRYSERYACKYEVHGKEYVVLQQYMVLATETA